MQVQTQRENQSVWRLDRAHTSVEFTIKKLFFFHVKGRFKDFDGTIVLDENENSASSVEATLTAKSIDTGNSSRDRQLRSASFLDSDSSPSIRFKSSQVGPGRDRDMLSVSGELTIRDKSRDIVLDVTEVDRSRSPQGDEVIYYVAETVLNRFDFGVNGWRGLVAPTLKVVINVQANRED
jgi:polyisoprenoid-binding protein YceI